MRRTSATGPSSPPPRTRWSPSRGSPARSGPPAGGDAVLGSSPLLPNRCHRGSGGDARLRDLPLPLVHLHDLLDRGRVLRPLVLPPPAREPREADPRPPPPPHPGPPAPR